MLKGYEQLEFWFFWVVATIAGMILGSGVAETVNCAIWPCLSPLPNQHITQLITNPVSRLFVLGVGVGLFSSLLQWFILRGHMNIQPWKWLIASMLGWAIGPALGEALEIFSTSNALSLIRGVLAGTIIGGAQWIPLKEVAHRREWWLLANGVSGLLISGIFTSGMLGPPGIGLVGFLHGASTGIPLVHMLPKPKLGIR